jgi:serine/threonine-protein kinase
VNNSDDDKTLLSDSDALVPTNVDGHGDESYCAACGGSYPMDVDVCPKDGARLTKLKAQPDALLGRVFDGRFEVRTSLGQGGMGTVYRGWQLTVDREIAIKVIHPKLASDRIAVKRFLREARLSSRLSQPNIVNVYDFGQTEDGILYIAMELLRGHTLGRELEAMRPLPLRRVLTIGQQLCDALDSAHGQGIVHRDLKPNNIVILDDPPGRDLIKVLDFGLAKSLVTDTSSLVTNTNAILGTPLYMPPEQIEGKQSDQRADLYSLGCILYQMLSGRPPFTGDNVNQVLAAHISEEASPLPSNVPPVLVRTVEHLMEKDPTKRMASARNAREAMQSIVEGGAQLGVEVYDTTPDIRPSALYGGAHDSSPIELAVTDPAGATRPAIRDSSGAAASSSRRGAEPISVEKSIDAAPDRRMRWIAPLAILGGLAIGGGAMYWKMSDSEAKKPVVDVPIAAPVAPDAMPIAIDAAPQIATPIDAAEAIVVDAAAIADKPPKKKRPKPDKGSAAAVPAGSGSSAPPPVKPPVGSGSGSDELPFLKSKAKGSAAGG